MELLAKGIEIRTEILKYSLLIERLSSMFLSELLNIKDFKKSQSLGNKSGNLSFNQKIGLLIDIQALSEKEKSKFVTFMSIRNQLMHNFDADSYEKCFKNINGVDNFLLRIYPQKEEFNKESKLKNATKELVNDVVAITAKLLEKVEEKIQKEVKSQILEDYQKDSIKAISQIEKTFNDAYEKKVKSGEKSINIEELKKLGSKIKSIFYRIVISKNKK